MKNAIIINGIYVDFLTRKKQLYEEGLDTYDKKNYLKWYDLETINECFKIYSNNKRRKYSTREEIATWFFAIDKIKHYENYKIIFGTLTFSDATLEKTTKETRRRYVARFLKKDKNIERYIANIDYGTKNEREHYHFLAFAKGKIDITRWKDINKLEVIKTGEMNFKKTIEYLLKLTNHAYKESTRLERIIKDRHEKDLLDLSLMIEQGEYKRYRVKNLGLNLKKEK